MELCIAEIDTNERASVKKRIASYKSQLKEAENRLVGRSKDGHATIVHQPFSLLLPHCFKPAHVEFTITLNLFPSAPCLSCWLFPPPPISFSSNRCVAILLLLAPETLNSGTIVEPGCEGRVVCLRWGFRRFRELCARAHFQP